MTHNERSETEKKTRAAVLHLSNCSFDSCMPQSDEAEERNLRSAGLQSTDL